MSDWNEDGLDEKEEAKVKGLLKSESEILKFTLPEQQPFLKGHIELLESGTPEQKFAVLNNVQLYIDDPYFFQALFAKLCTAIYEWPSTMQPLVSSTINKLFAGRRYKDEYAAKLMTKIFNKIDNGAEEIINVWYPTYCTGVRCLDWKVYSEKFLPPVIKLAEFGHTPVTRLAAAQMIAAAALSAGENKQLGGSVLKTLQDLFQDTDCAIRKAAIEELAKIIPKLEPAEVERLFFFELASNSRNLNVAIKTKAVKIVLEYHRLFSVQKLADEFLPVVMSEFVEGFNPDNSWLLEILPLSVPFFLERDGALLQDVAPIKQYLEIALLSHDTTLKTLSTKAIPAVMRLCASKSLPFAFEEILAKDLSGFQLPLLESLSDIVKTARELWVETHIQPCFDYVFLHAGPDVSAKLCPSLPEILKGILEEKEVEEKKRGEKKQEEYRKKLADRVETLWLRAEKRGWRVFAEFVREIPEIDVCLGVQEFNERSIGKLLEILANSGNNESKKTAAESICRLLLNNCVAAKREEVESEILKLSNSPRFSQRISFVRFCASAARYFSRQFLFASKVMGRYVTLPADKTVDVRIGFLRLAIEMFRMALNEDTEDLILEKVDHLKNDKSKEVRNLADSVYTDLKTNMGKYAKEKSSFTVTEDITREEREKLLFTREFEKLQAEEAQLKADAAQHDQDSNSEIDIPPFTIQPKGTHCIRNKASSGKAANMSSLGKMAINKTPKAKGVAFLFRSEEKPKAAVQDS